MSCLNTQNRLQIATFLVLGCSLLTANASHAQVRAGSAYLKLLPGARQQSVANSLTGGLDVAYGIYANPGATGFLREWQWSANYTKWISDIYNFSLLYGRQFGFKTPFGDRISLALGVNYQGVGDFDATGGLQASASANDLLLSASLGLPIGKVSRNLSLGANFKYLRSELAQFSASTFAFDVGAIYRTPRFRLASPGGGLFEYGIFSVGISVNHLGNSMKFISESTPLPRTIRGGVALNLGSHDGLQIQLLADYRDVRDEKKKVGVGIEVTNLLSAIFSGPVSDRYGRLIAFRAGYSFDDDRDSQLVSKFTVGLSLRFDDYMNRNAQRAPQRRSIFPSNNSAFRFDGGFIGSTLKTTIGQGSMTSRSIGPERFDFVESDFHSVNLTDKDLPAFDIDDNITLSWRASPDPDLYDDVNYMIMVVKSDSFSLKEFIKKSEDNKLDIFEFGRVPMLTDRGNNTRVTFQHYEPKELAQLNGDEVFQFPGNPAIFVKHDSTFFVDKKHKQLNYSIPQYHLGNGDYYWTVVAYDQNRHFRFINDKIAHFRVEENLMPNLTIQITPILQPLDVEPRRIILDGVFFDPDSSSYSSLSPQSKTALAKWTEEVKQEFHDVLIKAEGYADPTGPELGPNPSQYRKAYNDSLSLERARMIRDYLREHRVSVDSIIGYGEYRVLPRKSDESKKEWWARNRRVELIVKETKVESTKRFAQVVIRNSGDRVAENFTVTLYDSTAIPPHKEIATTDPVLLQSEYFANTNYASLETGASDTLMIPWPEGKSSIIGVIDKENSVIEQNEKDNIAEAHLFDLEVSQVPDQFIVQTNDTVLYTTTIKNHGPAVARNFSLTEATSVLLSVLPESFSVLPDEVELADRARQKTFQWSFDSLAAGKSKTITYKAVVKGGVTEGTLALENKLILKSANDIDLSNNVFTNTIYRTVVNFQLDKTLLLDISKNELANIVKSVKRFLAANPNEKLEIAGHASFESWLYAKSPQYYCRHNKELSQGRAEAVKNYLVRRGIDADRLVAIGYSYELTKKRFDNDTEQGRRRSRRVEIKPYQKSNINPQDCE